MKVKILTSIASSEWGAPNIGDVVEVPDAEAKNLIKAGYAEPVETVKREKAVAKKITRKAVK